MIRSKAMKTKREKIPANSESLPSPSIILAHHIHLIKEGDICQNVPLFNLAIDDRQVESSHGSIRIRAL